MGEQLLSVAAMDKPCTQMPTVADDLREHRNSEDELAASDPHSWAWANAVQLALFTEAA